MSKNKLTLPAKDLESLREDDSKLLGKINDFVGENDSRLDATAEQEGPSDRFRIDYTGRDDENDDHILVSGREVYPALITMLDEPGINPVSITRVPVETASRTR